MDGTYFVGKSELLNWINSTLDLNFTKIEQVRAEGRCSSYLDKSMLHSQEADMQCVLADCFRRGGLPAS